MKHYLLAKELEGWCPSPSHQPHEYVSRKGTYFTKFAGSFPDEEKMNDFLKRNGEFWIKRGIDLHHFTEHEIKLLNYGIDKVA